MSPTSDVSRPDEMPAVLPLFDRDGAVVAHALVDQTCLPEVGQFRWHLSAAGYPVRTQRGPEGVRKVPLHRAVLGLGPATEGEPRIRHLNGNKLDARLRNLAPCAAWLLRHLDDHPELCRRMLLGGDAA
jgi:hypothetical protein